MSRVRRHFTPEFKLEVAKKIVQQQCSITQLYHELNLGETAVRRWVAQYKAERLTPSALQTIATENCSLNWSTSAYD